MKNIVLSLFLASLLFNSCDKTDADLEGVNFKQEMRKFVQNISQYAKGINPDFAIIPQNGEQLVLITGETDGAPDYVYLAAIDGQGREDLFYGYDSDNQATSQEAINEMIPFLDVCVQNNVKVLVTDYCSTQTKMDDSYSKNAAKNYLSFAAPERNLNIIPDYPSEPVHVNAEDIHQLSDAKNFLYIINSENYSSKADFISALKATNYDVILIDYAFNEDAFTKDEINSLKVKNNGGKRLIISYMSIGEAETYRYYWQNDWKPGKPEWLDKENPDWAGNYKVRYWNSEWQQIIYGNDNSYLKKIIDAGFDGVYLDIIDAFEYYEEM
ncbi:MAG: endo alpha-1,4 polygalactosaminidase [Bacteroidales bacterium]|nr:endo alpha-1,4 polygalactosaminidase [Bacteroidales bacterium]